VVITNFYLGTLPIFDYIFLYVIAFENQFAKKEWLGLDCI
jgi:hypothetical protein